MTDMSYLVWCPPSLTVPRSSWLLQRHNISTRTVYSAQDTIHPKHSQGSHEPPPHSLYGHVLSMLVLELGIYRVIVKPPASIKPRPVSLDRQDLQRPGKKQRTVERVTSRCIRPEDSDMPHAYQGQMGSKTECQIRQVRLVLS